RTASDEDPARTLSQLESSLLLDTAALFVQALSTSCDEQDFRIIGNIVSGRFPLDLEDTEEICRITFNTKRAGAQDDPVKASLFMPCDKLESAAKIRTQTIKTLSAEAASSAIMEHLQKIPIIVTAELGSASVAFGQLMSLAANDVIILDTKVSEPVKLIVNNMDLFHGRAAKSAGKYAVAITNHTPANRSRHKE
ncbi:MAG: FliM/FliN family flagellar motor switch protein, partial [Sedimentisphaerales bacterium]|nr:FliM/FliN family flagellar motor switch protein [Sedimentisphaerales bacterium]